MQLRHNDSPVRTSFSGTSVVALQQCFGMTSDIPTALDLLKLHPIPRKQVSVNLLERTKSYFNIDYKAVVLQHPTHNLLVVMAGIHQSL